VQHGIFHADFSDWKVVNEADNALVKQDEKERLKGSGIILSCARCRQKIIHVPRLDHLKALSVLFVFHLTRPLMIGFLYQP